MPGTENFQPNEKEFKSNLPQDLIKGLDEHTKYIYNSLNVIQQQNEHIIREQKDVKITLNSKGDEIAELKKELEITKERLAAYDRLYLAFTSRKSVYTGICALIVIPIFVLVMTDLLIKLFKHL